MFQPKFQFRNLQRLKLSLKLHEIFKNYRLTKIKRIIPSTTGLLDLIIIEIIFSIASIPS